MKNNVQSLLLLKNEIKTIQPITGSFLYYTRVLNCIILLVLNKIAYTQASTTEYTKEEFQQLMDYAATYLQIFV